MITAQVVETSVTVNNNSPIQDYIHLDDQTQPTFKILFLKPTVAVLCKLQVLQAIIKANSWVLPLLSFGSYSFPAINFAVVFILVR